MDEREPPNAGGGKLSIFWQSLRLYSLPAALVPVLVGSALAFSYHGGSAVWALLPVVIACSLLFQMGTNVINDYCDYTRGVDQDRPSGGGSGVLTANLMGPGRAFVEGRALFGAGVLLGVVLIYVRGVPMAVLGLVGLLGGYFYSGGPRGYKYLALGDIAVFLLMGPLMVIGTYFVLTGSYTDPVVLYVSLPVGFLVAAILAVNNHRDIASDAESPNTKTLAMVIGFKASRIEYYLLVISAYLSVAVMVMVGVPPHWTLSVFASVPLALANLETVRKSGPGQEERLAPVVPRTAQRHLLFGVILAAGIVAGALG
jgi:1,4-dihydroxy-2-naphthoate octaprenyltransferase